jgi:hypothetical protein
MKKYMLFVLMIFHFTYCAFSEKEACERELIRPNEIDGSLDSCLLFLSAESNPNNSKTGALFFFGVPCIKYLNKQAECDRKSSGFKPTPAPM